MTTRNNSIKYIIKSMIVFVLILATLNFVIAANTNIADDVRACILDNIDIYDFKKETTIYYYEPSCEECFDFVNTLNTDKDVFQTTDCFSDVGESLAVCLNNFEISKSKDSEDLSEFVDDCADYKVPEREFITLDRPGDDDGDYPIVIFKDNGEIQGLDKTIYDLFGSESESVEKVVEKNDNVVEIILNATEDFNEAQDKVKFKEFKESAEKEFKKSLDLEKEESDCFARNDKIVLKYKQDVKDVMPFKEVNGEKITVDVDKERERIYKKMAEEQEDCKIYTEQIEAIQADKAKKYQIVAEDPKGLNMSRSKYNEKEREFLKENTDVNEKYLLHKLSKAQIEVEKLNDGKKEKKGMFSRFEEWVKELLLKVF